MKTRIAWVTAFLALVTGLTWAASTRFGGNAGLVYNRTISVQPIRLHEVRGWNDRGTDCYIQVLECPITNGVPALTNGLIPVVSELAFATLSYGIKFQEPLDIRSCVIAASSTVSNLTLIGTGNGVTITAIYSSGQ